MKSIFIFLACGFSIQLFANKTEYKGKDAEKIIDGASQVIVDEQRHSISFVVFKENHLVSEYNHLPWLKSKILQLRADDDLVLIRKEQDNIGFTHYRYGQVYKNIPVEYGVVIVHAKNGRIVSVNTEFYSGINLNTGTVISSADALEIAKAKIHSQKLSSNPTDPVSLVIYPEENRTSLTYKADVYSEIPLTREFIFVDAKTGKILNEISRIHYVDVTGTAVTRYSGTRNITTDSVAAGNYRLRETGRGGGIQTWNLNHGSSQANAVDFTDTDNYWNTTTNYDDAANDCHLGTEGTYDYYWTRYGRNSYDNAGAILKSYVHYSTNYVNAFWDGSVMTYGDGDGSTWFPLTSTEVTGHEVTHGVTEHSSGLIYSGESGALNESFSDIFGTAIDFYVNPTTANWRIGDSFNAAGSAFRDMADPNLYTDPDTYGGTYWNAGNDVHVNSGVQNHWYYILSLGDAGTNDLGNTYSVTGIGINTAADIAYRNNAHYLTPSSTYADSKTYSIQAAIDLFGQCSNEVIQTANAWYAVGVGGVFSNAVVANFNSVSNYFCVLPASVTFINQSINSSSFVWDFGDGDTSSSTNPTHVYSTAGNYTITLIANGSASCGNSDTLIQTSFIHVTNGGGPQSISCSPTTQSYCCSIGIYQVQFNTINRISGNASEGYKDFTCSNSTSLVAGSPYTITITTGTINQENVRVWIDYNNDGALNQTNELVFSSTALRNHTGVIYTPVTAVTGTPLRMRVMSDNYSYPITSSCSNPQNGQAEDYTIQFSENTLPPIANFLADDTVVNVGQTVNFFDLTMNAPTSWNWYFTGAVPSGSTTRNPTAVYNAIGTYPVTFVVYNAFGHDSITRSTYIQVVNTFNMCGASSSVATSGILYDPGGPTGNYSNYTSCSFIIDPGCATSLTLTFASFQTESGYDYVRIYNGTSNSDPLLLNTSGSTIPNPITASSGKMLVVFTTDGSVVYPGFEASWTSVLPAPVPPVTDFSMSTNNPPLNTNVQFTDQSSNFPNQWYWAFGDGTYTTIQNPIHAYNTPGTYSISLIAWNCFSSDTITYSINVQQAPLIILNPDTINLTVSCSDSLSIPIDIINAGLGELKVHVSGAQSSNAMKVLALTYGTDLTTEYRNTFLALNQHFTNYILDTIYTTNPSDLQNALAGHDVFLMAEPENGSPSVYLNFAPVLQNYVSNGGTVVMCGTYSSQTVCIFNTGLITGTYYSDATGVSISVTDTSHPIMDSVPVTFTGTNGTYCLNLTSPNTTTLANYLTSSVVAVREIGDGEVIYIAFDYNTYQNTQSRILGNTFKWISSYLAPPWIDIPTIDDTISISDTTTFSISINSSSLIGGTYTTYISIQTNDPLHPTVQIPVTLVVSGPPVITLSDTCLDYGTVFANATVTDSFTIHSIGCDTLNVSSITSDNSSFTTQFTTVSMPAHDSIRVVVQFNPTAIGNYSGHLHILNSDVDTVICLNGIAIAAPVYSHSPDSLASTISLNSCSDSVTVQMIINNSGGNNLSYHIELNKDTAQILALTYGTDTITEFPHTFEAINQFFHKYTLDTVNTTSGSVLQNRLIGKNIFLMTKPETGNPFIYSNFAAPLQNFVNTGGTAIICGTTGSQVNSIFNTGLLSGTYGTDSYGRSVTNILPSHPIMNGVPTAFLGTYSGPCLNLTNTGTTLLATCSGSASVAIVPHGAGNVVYIGFDFQTYDVEEARIIANAVEWAQQNASRLSISPDNGTVIPGDNDTLYLTINSTGLEGGPHSTFIVAATNDPLHLYDTIPVTFNVSHIPCADFNESISGCTGLACLQGSLFNNPTSWNWDLGDGTIISGDSICHQYSVSGTYYIKLTSCNSYGCDSIIKTISVAVNSVPAPASCSPATIGNCCGLGILNVELNTINNSSNDGSVGYEDFTCDVRTNLILGQTYTLRVTTGISYSETVQAWIDFNNNGIFSTSELVAGGLGSGLHTFSISNLNFATINTPLRMRIGSDYQSEPVPLPCASVRYGQFEDYTVVIEPNTNPPVSDFTYSYGCTGFSCFSDSTLNGPTSWDWDFGDGVHGTGDTICHQYTSSGIYNVKLVSCNSIDCDSITKTISVSVNSGPVPALCSPATTANCCSIGILNVQLNTINNSSANGIAGYEDFSCSHQTSLMLGQTYTLSVQTGPTYPENVQAWIDLNNDGDFSASELVATGSGTVNHTFNLPSLNTAVLNTPLRMRIGSDYYSNPVPTPCLEVYYGQFEDYAVMIEPNIYPPVTNYQYVGGCSGYYCFTDSSLNGPTSWNWDFGNGNFGTGDSICHQFTASGTYNVQLKSCNAIGCDSIIKTISVVVNSGPIPASCTPLTLSNCCGIGIVNVQFNSINNSSADGSVGYEDFSCTQQTILSVGASYSLRVQTGIDYTENVLCWIDYDNDGIFTTAELVGTDAGLGMHIINMVPSNTAVLNTPLRMRLGSDYTGQGTPSPCTNVYYGQFEDYTVQIQPITIPPVSNFMYLNKCNGSFCFADSSQYFPNTWDWDFGDGTTGTGDSICHQYSTAGNYDVKLVTCNTIGCDTIIKTIAISFPSVPAPASCYPVATNPCCNSGIISVQLDNINNISAAGTAGYEDFTCAYQAILYVGVLDTLFFHTGRNECTKAYIDYNNNGVFSSNEEIGNGCMTTSYIYYIMPPASAVLNTPLRLRIGSDYYSPSPCTNPLNGQFEDYSVVIELPNSVTPVSVPGLNIRVFPNPFPGTMTLTYQIEETNKVTVELFNIIGEKISTVVDEITQLPGYHSHQINVDAPGVYLLKVQCGNTSELLRIVNIR